MKKLLSVLMAIMMLASVCTVFAYAGDSDPVANLIADIDSLGGLDFVTAGKDYDKIDLLLTEYNMLSDDQKAAVTNAQALLDAKAKVDALMNEDVTMRDMASKIDGLATLTKEALEDEEEILCVDYNFYEIEDRSTNNCGYSQFDDSDRVKNDRFLTLDFDVKMNSFDRKYGSPYLAGYVNAGYTDENGEQVRIGDFAAGYDFVGERFFFGRIAWMSNDKLIKTYQENKMPFTLGNWHHMTITYDANHVTIEFDGETVIDIEHEREIGYDFYIFYPQWIDGELINVVYTAGDDSVIPGPLKATGGAWETSTLRGKTMGQLRTEALEDVLAEYDALTDAQKETLGKQDVVEAARALITPPAPAFTYGDVNGDDAVNAKDVSVLVKNAAGFEVEFNEAAADVNGDGKVNSKDISQILKYLAGWKVELGAAQ